VLLDEKHGFAPHNTWTDTTFGNAYHLLSGYPAVEIRRIGCLRAYATRHGRGPLVTENPAVQVEEPWNSEGKFQGAFRTGYFDAVAVRYALAVIGGVDEIALSHMDSVGKLPVKALCDHYDRSDGLFLSNGGWPEWATQELETMRPIYRTYDTAYDLVQGIERALQTPITILGHGVTAEDRWRRKVWPRMNWHVRSATATGR
jgi:adenylosuccinate synthase